MSEPDPYSGTHYKVCARQENGPWEIESRSEAPEYDRIFFDLVRANVEAKRLDNLARQQDIGYE